MLINKNQTICNICKCFWKPHDDKTVIDCDGAAIKFIPKIEGVGEIYAANNKIETIEEEDLPDTLTFLDLQYNQLKHFDKATLSRLFSLQNRSVQLAGNPLICNCDSKLLIQSIQFHEKQITDYRNLTCVDGTLLNTIDPSALCFTQTSLVVIISILCILIFISAGIYVAWTKFGRKIKTFLYTRGWRCYIKDNDKTKKKYDVFISFAPEDETFVMEELLPKWEAESSVVCLYNREWCVEDWIPAQTTKLVAGSIMTLVVLSSNFLKTPWALLEFREAHAYTIHDRRARLGVLLLGDVLNDPRLDSQLRAYLATATCVRWNEPLSWEKLMYALPQPNFAKPQDNLASGHEVVRLIKPNDPSVQAPQNGLGTSDITELI